jgi:hypothetical protein
MSRKGAGCAKTLRGPGAPPNFEGYRLAEREKSSKFALWAAIRTLSSSFRTASAESGPKGSRWEQPESAGDRAFGATGYRLTLETSPIAGASADRGLYVELATTLRIWLTTAGAISSSR